MANFNFSIAFNVEKEGINKAQQELSKLKQEMKSNPMKFNLDQNSLKTAMQQVSVFESSLEKAFNQNLGKLDTREFVKQLHTAGYSLREIREGFTSMGVNANRSIDSIERGLQTTNLSLKKTSALIDSMGTTFANSLRWNIASQSINGIQSSISRAIGFVRELDTSLNNIQIVSGKSSEEMKVFAQSANEAAQSLGKTTTEYSDASLIYFQQGKSASEVRKLTEATLVGANITGQDTAETAELLTAALNGYNLAADKAMLITDKFAAVGAGTGSDFSELAIGFSKVASMASVAGVSVDQLNGMLATTSTVTREAPESIGTSYKTIFGRMTEMKAGKADEDGWKLGQVNDALSKAGFSMLDETTGKLKETGVLIEEVGDKWADLNKETKLALSTAMAGSRQQNRLVALYENWDMYKEAVQMSQEAEGTAYEQNLVKMNTVEIKSKQLRAALEEMWMKMINSEAMKKTLDFLTGFINKTNDLIDTLGGVGPVLAIIIASFTRLMSGKISNGLVGVATNIKSDLAAIARNKQLTNASASNSTDDVERQRLERLQAQYNIRKYLTQEEHKEYIALQKTLETEEKKTRQMKENIKLAKEYLNSSQFNGNINKMSAQVTANSRMANQSGNAAKQLSKFDGASMTGAKGMDMKSTLVAIRELDAAYKDYDRNRLLALKREGKSISEIIGKLNEKKRMAEQENAEIKERLSYLSEEYELATLQQQSTLKEVEDNEGKKMDTISSKASSVGNIQKLVNGATSATIAINGLVSSLKSFNAAGDNAEAKAEAVSAGFLSIGTALLMSGNPYAMIAGGIVDVIGAIIPLIDYSTALEKTMKANKELMTSYSETVVVLRQNLTDLAGMQASYIKFQNLTQSGGIGTLDTENKAEYYAMMDKMSQLYPELIEYYDDEGRAIINLNKSFDELKNTQKEKIKIENDSLISNKDSFVYEYTENKKKITQEMALNNLKLQKLEIDKRNALISKNTNKFKDVTKEMAEIQASVDESKKSLQEMPGKINTTIVQPFLNATNSIGNMDNATKSLITTLWNQDEVQKILSKDTATAQKELDKLQAITIRMSSTIALLNKQAEEGDEKAASSFNKLGTLAPATTKMILQALSLLPITEEQTITSIERIANKLDKLKTNISKNAITIDDIIDFNDQESMKGLTAQIAFLELQLNGKDSTMTAQSNSAPIVEQRIDGLKDQLRKAKADLEQKREALDKVENESYNPVPVPGETAYSNENVLSGKPRYEDSAASHSLRVEAAKVDVAKSEEENKALEDKIEETQLYADRLNDIVNKSGPGYIDFQNQLNKLYSEQVYTLASTVDGYNQLVDIYNEEYSSLGELMGLYEENAPEMQSIFDIITYGSEKGLNGIYEAGTAIEELGAQLQDLGSPLENLTSMFPDLSVQIKDVMDNGSKASEESIRSVYDALNNGQSQMNSVFLALNKDNADFFNTFKDTEGKKIELAAQNLGVMAENYSTYGEYKDALDQAAYERYSIIASETLTAEERKELEIKNNAKDTAKAKVEAEINSAKDAIATGTDYKNAYAKLQVARSKASKIASLEAQQAQAKSDREILKGMIDTLRESGSFWDKIKGAVGAGIIGETESQIKFLDAKIDSIDDLIQQAANGPVDASIVDMTSGVDDEIGKGIDTSIYDPETSGGGSNNPYKKFTTPQYRTNPKTGDSGPGVNPNARSNSSKPRVQEDMKVDFDTLILHDTNILLQQQEDLLKRLKDEEDKLYGKAKMDNLTKQNEALTRKKEILQQQLNIIKQHASEMRTSLQSQGAQFNTDGTISNYEAIIKAKVASANAISDADAKKAAQDAVKQFMDDLKQYEDYQLKVTIDKEQAISEVEKLQREIYMTQFEYKITVQLELSKDQEEIIKFLKDVNNEFEDMSDTYKETMNDLNGTLGAVEAIQEQLDKTLKDTTLTDKERIELLDKYEKEMEDAVAKAQKLREELVKLNEEALKGGLSLLDEQLNKYENIGKELDHITNMLKLTGNQQEFSVIDKIYEAQEKGLKGQLNALLKTKTLLNDMLSKQAEGSKEWKATNEQLVKMNEQINKITEETLKTFQEEFNNSFNSIMDKLDKQLSGGMGFDKLKDRWSELKSDGEKYLSTQEKIIWAGNMQYDIQQKLNESTNPETRKRLQEFLDEELNTLTKKGTLTEYEVDRAKKLYDITVAQIALDEARNNKTIQRLVRDSSGNWSYQYMEDTKKVAEAQKSLTDKAQALMVSDKKAFIENQDEMIAAKIAFEKEIEDIIKQAQNGQYASEEKFQAALVEAKTRFETRITTLQKEGDSIRQYSSESTMAAILATYTVNKGALETLTAEQKILLEELGVNVGISWNNIREALKATNVGNAEDYKTLFTDIVIGHGENMSTELSKIYDSIGGLWDTTTGKMTISNINLSTVVNTTIEEIKNSWQEYQNKVNEVTLVVGGDLQSLISETETLGATTAKLGTETINTITSIQDQWNKVAELIREYQKLDGTQYDAIMKAAIEYIKQLDDIIKKQKEAATGITTPKVDTPIKAPTKTPITKSPATTPSKPVAAPAPSKPSTPSIGDTVSVIPNTWTSDSYGRGPTGNPWSWSWGPWRIDQYIPGRSYPYHVAATDGVSGTGWVNSVKFDTGGYTGEWGDNEGKMAMLHQKEIVLNKEDTSNILSAVQIVRDYASMIKKLVGGVGSFAPSTGGAVEQSVTINADFSGVKSSFEIEKAFENMANRASQFIQRK